MRLGPDPAAEGVGDVRVAHRLGDVVVHAGVEAALAVAVHCVCGDGDYGTPLVGAFEEA